MLESSGEGDWAALMTYFKCTCCKARLYSVASPDSLVRDLCPCCGTSLAPVGELVGVRGYHSIAARSLGPLSRINAASREGLKT
jgi:hypothetical protein